MELKINTLQFLPFGEYQRISSLTSEKIHDELDVLGTIEVDMKIFMNYHLRFDYMIYGAEKYINLPILQFKDIDEQEIVKDTLTARIAHLSGILSLAEKDYFHIEVFKKYILNTLQKINSTSTTHNIEKIDAEKFLTRVVPYKHGISHYTYIYNDDEVYSKAIPDTNFESSKINNKTLGLFFHYALKNGLFKTSQEKTIHSELVDYAKLITGKPGVKNFFLPANKNLSDLRDWPKELEFKHFEDLISILEKMLHDCRKDKESLKK